MLLEKLEKLKKYPSDLILLIVAALAIVILLAINILIFEPLAYLGYGYGILDFEFAWTKEQILIIFGVWGDEVMTLQAAGVYWDFLYIIGYTVPLFALILFVSRKLDERILNIGLCMSLTPFIAGIFDIVENVNLLIMLNEAPAFASFVPLIASLSATIKFGILIVGVIFFLVILVLLVLKKIKK
ncbi:unnamed protein product [marine sediment metagenome]|uniref:Uncharacterized protein n=1 Tax=marine sediment metagenome TaxID=412755 RepID=X1Q8L2_9ZZZZ